MDRQLVLEALYAAFAEQPIPLPEIDPDLVHPSDQEKTQEFARALESKNWRSLTPEFCEPWRYYFGLLKPTAYVYYLPALLVGSLLPAPSEHDPIHSTVFAINPSLELVHRDGTDAYLTAHQAAFSEPQYRAVCDFLGQAFEEGDRFDRFRTALGLRWGWNSYPTVTLDAANAYFQEMSTCIYPESADPRRAEICREIREAFAATPYPGDANLAEPGGEEPGEIAMGLRGVAWQSAHPHLLDACSSALSFLSDAGFRYFLPSFLQADLLQQEMSEWDYYGNSDPVFHLIHGLFDAASDPNRISLDNLVDLTQNGTSNPWAEAGVSDEAVRSMVESMQKMGEIAQAAAEQGIDWERYRVRRFEAFTPAERRVIIRYLEFRAEDEFAAVSIEQALTNYWRPSLAASEAEQDG